MKRFRNEIGVGVLLLAALAALLYMSFKVGALKSLGNTIEVEAVFDDAAGLVEDSDVRLAGVRVGGVDRLQVEDGRCVATLVIRRDADLRQDARAEIRARSVLGEKYVAMIHRSDTAELLDSGDRIVDTAIPYEIDQMVTALGPMLERLNPDDVAAIVTAVADIARSGDDIEAQGLVAEAERLLHNLNEMAEVAPAVKRDVPVILTNLRSSTENLDSTLTRLDRVLTRTEDLLDRLDESTAELPETMEDVRVSARELREISEALGDSSDEIGPILEDLAIVLENLSEFDSDEITRLLREEGVRVRTAPPKKN